MNERAAWLVGLWYAAIAVVPLVVLAAAFALSADPAQADAVRSLARARAGCETELRVERTGAFYVYVESRGRQTPLGGNCATTGGSFESQIERPRVEVELRRGDTEVELERSSGINYDIVGYRGELIRVFDATSPGLHVVTVRSDHEVVVAIGIDVNAVYRNRMVLAAWTAIVTVFVFFVVWGAVGVVVDGRRDRRSGLLVAPPAAPGVFVTAVVPPTGPPMVPPPPSKAAAPPARWQPPPWDPPQPR